MTREDIIRIYNQVSDELCGGKEWALTGVEEPLQRFAALVAEHERAAEREALEKIATVNAMDYEYVRWAKAALRREDV